MVGYNVQGAVDEKHHQIVTHEVSNDATDRAQLDKLSKQAKRVLDASTPTVVADAGFYYGQAGVDCYEAGIQALVPKVEPSSSKSQGKYSKAAFRYDAVRNEYVCPAGVRLTYRLASAESRTIRRFRRPSRCLSMSEREEISRGDWIFDPGARILPNM